MSEENLTVTTALVGVDAVEAAIRSSWTAETSVDEGWSPDNPALGQCAVTALVVQDYLGGALMRTTVDGVSHYYNMVVGPEGPYELDLTRDQFPVWEPTEAVVRDREYVVGFPATKSRYEALKSAVDAVLT